MTLTGYRLQATRRRPRATGLPGNRRLDRVTDVRLVEGGVDLIALPADALDVAHQAVFEYFVNRSEIERGGNSLVAEFLTPLGI